MISDIDFKNIITQVKDKGLTEPLIEDLRNRYADYHFTYCMDDDMEANNAFMETEAFNVYLVNSQNHCSTITSELDNASGLVLAEVISD